MEIKPGVTKWANTYILELNDEEIAELTRPANGIGGFQDLFRKLQSQLNQTVKTVKLTDEDLDRIPHVAFDVGQGGFEDRLVQVFGRLLGPGLKLPDVGGQQDSSEG